MVLRLRVKKVKDDAEKQSRAVQETAIVHQFRIHVWCEWPEREKRPNNGIEHGGDRNRDPGFSQPEGAPRQLLVLARQAFSEHHSGGDEKR